MNAKDYLALCGLPPTLLGDDLRQAGAVIAENLKEARAQSVPATPKALNGIYQYKVPRLSADGRCSVPNELAEAPYDLGAILGGRQATNTICLLAINSLVDLVQTQLDVAWLGVYQLRERTSGPVAVKLAARGQASRAEFPLTADFALRSNNVAVAFSGKARVLKDVHAHASAGGAYYECDPAVQSEACLPVFAENGQAIGIIDAEHTTKDYFIERRLAWLVALALAAPMVLPPGGSPQLLR